MNRSKIENKLIELEERLFFRHNINESAKLMLRTIEDEIIDNVNDKQSSERTDRYFEQLKTIYKDSLIEEQPDGTKISCFHPKIIRQYSILKYFYDCKIEMMLDFSLDAALILLENLPNTEILFHKLEIQNVVTGEEIIPTQKEKKLLLLFIKNIALMTNYQNYTFDFAKNEQGNHIVAYQKTKK